MNKKRILALALTVATLSAPIVANAQSQGWSKTGNNWVYINGKNRREKGWLKVGNVWYHFNQNGIMETGWIKYQNKWYFLDNSGAMRTGWLSTGGAWYYLNSDGHMETGWLNDNGTWYYLNQDGAMRTGWLEYNGDWYCFNGSGAMMKNEFSGEYYLLGNGVMAKNTYVQGYHFDANGVRHKTSTNTTSNTNTNVNNNTNVDNHNDSTTTPVVPNKPKEKDPVVPNKPKEKDKKPDTHQEKPKDDVVVPEKPNKPDVPKPKDKDKKPDTHQDKPQTKSYEQFIEEVKVEFDKEYRAYRKAHGKPDTHQEPLMAKGTKIRAQEMADTNILTHTRPNGKNALTVFNEDPRFIEMNSYKNILFPAGENIWVMIEGHQYSLNASPNTVAKRIIDAFDKSTHGHKEQMLNASKNAYYMDMARAKDGKMYIAFEFAKDRRPQH